MIARLLTLGARTAGGLPITVWIIAGLLLALGGLEVARRVQVSGLRADLAQCQQEHAQDRERAQAAALAQAQANAAETARRVAAHQEAQRAHDKALSQARADADAARGASLRLSRQLAAYAAAHRGTASDPAAAGERAAADDPIGVLAHVLGLADARAGVLAEVADRARIAGQQCEAAYDSLTLKLTVP